MKKNPVTPTPPPEPAEPELTAATARRALQYDLANLLRRVKSGQPLTRYQRQLVEEKLHAPGAEPTPAGAAFARNQTQLAAALGVSRQLIAYHAKRPGSPGHRPDGRYEVRAWRSYLQVNGRVAVTEGAPHHGQGNASFSDLADFGAMRGLERAATVLPLVLTESLQGRMTEQEQAKLASEIWAAMCCRLTGFLTSDTPRSVPMETPPQILAMCAKVGVPVPQGIDIGMDDATEP